MAERIDVSLVVPTFNERERLEELVNQAQQALSAPGLQGEIIIVDDNSPDGTGEIADRLAARPGVLAVHRPGKLGLGSAVVAGFQRASGAVLGVMDADLSHPPALLPALVATLRSRPVDMVIASRYIPGGGCQNWPLRRRILSRVGCLLARGLTPVRDVTSGFFLVRREALEDTTVSAPGFKVCLELLMRSRVAAVAEIPYVFKDRAAGRSKMTVREALNYFVQLKDLYLLSAVVRREKRRAKHLVLAEREIQSLVGRSLETPCK